MVETEHIHTFIDDYFQKLQINLIKMGLESFIVPN